MDVRRVVAGTGRTMIAAGVLILLFVAYQLWGTGIAEARSQDDLRAEFEEFVEAPGTTTQTPRTTGAGGRTTSTTEPIALAALPDRRSGDPVAIIRIPKLDVEKVVVEDVTTSALKKGPGHYPKTPFPGQPGNAAIAGHRTTYGAPFGRLDELEPGDRIEVATRQGDFVYRVQQLDIVAPSRVDVLDPTDDNRLTLTTCHPRYSARQRLIVVAGLTDEPATPPPSTKPPEAEPTTTIPGEDAEPTVEAGLSGDPAARGPAIAWGSLAAAVWLVSWLASKKVGRVAAYAVGTPVFGVVLFIFFENFARLLPPNI